jgi:hypothetical protein
MSRMLEVYLSETQMRHRAEAIGIVVKSGGRVTHEESHEPVKTGKGMCLTVEFDSLEMCRRAIKDLGAEGFHTEGPSDY